MAAFSKIGLWLIKELGATSWGTITGGLSTVWNLIKGAGREVMKFHEEGIAVARDMGMSLNQAQAYTKALTKNTKELAFQYGVTSEAIMKIQKGISEATNKQIFLNKEQTKSFTALSKLAGDTSVSKFAEEMMNGMGAQVDAVEGAIAKAYASAAKNGLSAKKTTEIIANSLNIANKLSFRNGVDGLTKMAMQAQKIGMSLQSVESVAKTFMDFDSAIEHSAQLQMLGGAAGAFGGNPLDMMYEANYDPESLQDRMSKMLGGYAQFNDKTGISKINGMNMDFIRNIAKAMGMDEGEAVKVAKKNAELTYKKNKFGNAFKGLTEEQQNAIMNRSYVKNGKLYVNDAGNNAHEITNGIDEKSNLFKELTQFEGKSDREIMEQQASSLVSINDRINGLIESIKGTIGEKLVDYIPKIQEFITENGGKILAKVEKAATEDLPVIINWIKDFAKDAKKFFENLKKNWEDTKQILRRIEAALLAIGAVWGVSQIGKLGKGALSKFSKKTPTGGKPSGGASGTSTNKPVGPTGGSSSPNSVKGSDGHIWTKENGRWTRDDGKTKLSKGERNNLNEKLRNSQTSVASTQSQATSSSSGGAQNANGGAKGGGLWNKAKNLGKKGAKIGGKLGKGGGLAAVFAGLEGYFAKGDYDAAEKEIILSDLSDEEKKEALKEARKRRNEAYGSAAGAAILGTAGALIPGANIVGAIGGGMLGDWLGSKIGGAGLFNGDIDDKELTELIKKHSGEQHYTGGVVGKKDNVIGIATGEIVLSKTMQENLVSILKNPGVYSKPVGQNDFTYKPGRTETSKVGDSIVTVKDFNINLGGTLRLDGSGSSANLNVSELLKDPQFIGQLKDVISDAISSSYNGGRKMNDIATMRGMVAQTTTIGRRG